ncbi:heterokaryon incompatibility protein-domain-containing protein [Podospora didyma]|uniref:Heterokaryon incompatibility protein-domain-containing protein n=1 Tax=Podospora didyma TaxID=330526 RepID=A0AAE0P0R7_9PEZI|nr:heterokaryon incompatibility protein-domain-containing protein [Podospora didyma]
MRLINATNYQLQEFYGDQIPEYVILSHTWGRDEVSLQDLQGGNAPNGIGFQKIRYCCGQAIADGFQWAWVDTCCIDKTNSVELSEAINSMFQWYRDSSICYVYLEDVDSLSDDPDFSNDFMGSRWFTRGWTLQELIAPPTVEFYNHNWDEIGTKSSLRERISSTTGIKTRVLQGDDLSMYSAAEKLSWASDRTTTRVEDIAYSLMGLFGINMPMLYGEGNKAFIRLQEEIVKSHFDQSIFAWTAPHPHPGYLARSPADFRDFREHPDRLPPRGANPNFFDVNTNQPPPTVSSRGLKATLLLRSADNVPRRCLAVLYWIGEPPRTPITAPPTTFTAASLICILIEQNAHDSMTFTRLSPESIRLVPVTEISSFRWTPIYLEKSESYERRQGGEGLEAIQLGMRGAADSDSILGVYPLDLWALEREPTYVVRRPAGPPESQDGALLIYLGPTRYFLVYFGMCEGAPWCVVERIPEGVAQAAFGTDQIVRRFLRTEGMANARSDRHIEPTRREVSAALRRVPAASDGTIRYRLQMSFRPG